MEVVKQFLALTWLVTLIAFIVYWRKKVGAKKSAGENYKDDENYKSISKTKRIIGLICIASFVILGAMNSNSDPGSSNYSSSPSNSSSSSSTSVSQQLQQTQEKKSQETQRDYAEADINVLISDAKNNAAKANRDYKGKYVKIVGGVLDHVESDGDYISVSNGDMTLLHLQCYPRNKQVKEQILNLNNGQTVTIYGKIKDVGGIVGYQIDMDKVE